MTEVEKYFDFAKYLNEFYSWHDNTKDGDVYRHTSGVVMDQKQIYNRWWNYMTYKKYRYENNI